MSRIDVLGYFLLDVMADDAKSAFEGDRMNIIDFPSYFTTMQDCAFATVYADLPYVRPMALLFVDGEFYVTTRTNSNKVNHLRANNHFSIFLLTKKADTDLHIQGKGTAEIIIDATLKNRVFHAEPMISCYWQGPVHPDFTLLKLNFTELFICD